MADYQITYIEDGKPHTRTITNNTASSKSEVKQAYEIVNNVTVTDVKRVKKKEGK